MVKFSIVNEMSPNTDTEDEKTVFLQKMNEVMCFLLSAGIKGIDKRFQQGSHNYIDSSLLFLSFSEQMCDMQNIPKWKRQVSNWSVDVVMSLSWASAWANFLDSKRQKFEKESGLSDFLSFAKSDHFDSMAWFYAKHHLDNSIFRLYSFREKIAWFLNSHAKLMLIDTERDRLSFLAYLKKTEGALQPLYGVIQIFNSEKARDLMKYYRNQFVHNETPAVDWPKEPQAEIHKIYNAEGKLVSTAIPLFDLNLPDFQSGDLLQKAIDVWGQFVDGTEQLAEHLEKTYYSKSAAGKQAS